MFRLVGAALITRVCDRETEVISQGGRRLLAQPGETIAYSFPQHIWMRRSFYKSGDFFLIDFEIRIPRVLLVTCHSEGEKVCVREGSPPNMKSKLLSPCNVNSSKRIVHVYDCIWILCGCNYKQKVANDITNQVD